MSDHADDRKVSHDYVEDSGSVDLNAVAMAASYVPGTAAEKALVWKIDKHIIVSLLFYFEGAFRRRANSSSPPSGCCTCWGISTEPTSGMPKQVRLCSSRFSDRADQTGGIERDLNLSSTQYSIVLLVFFVSYVLFEIPSNLLIAVSPD